MLKVELYKTPDCANCEKVKSLLEKLKKEEFPKMKIAVKNLLEHQDIISKHQIFSSPGLFINGEYVLSGAATKEQLKEKLKEFQGGKKK